MVPALFTVVLHRIASFAPNNKSSLLERRNNNNFLLSASSAANNDPIVPTPPVPFRDENDFVLAGELPDEALHSTSPPLIRQSKSSTNPLLSPARKIPNPYGWMRDDSRKNTTVLDYLREENEYTRVMTKHLEGLQEELYNEFINSIEETDYTTPAASDGFWYYSRFIEGLSYPIYCRAPREEGELYYPPINERWNEKGTTPFDMQPLLPGEVAYLNLPQMAKNNRTYLALGVYKISPNDQYVAYSLDELGDEKCHLYVKHIESDQEWILYDGDDYLEGDGSICWDGKGKAIFFCTLDATRRSHRLYRRQLFDDEGNYIDAPKQHDELIFEEKDATFSLRISKSFDSRYLVLTCSAKESTELHYIDLQQEAEGKTVAEQLKCISKREDKLCYRVTHCFGYWLVQTNNKGDTPNLSLKACKVGEEKDSTCWLDVVNASKIGSNSSVPIFDGGNERSLDGITIFSPDNNDDAFTPFAYGVVTGREAGMPRVWVLEFTEEGASSKASPLKVTKSCRLEFDESAYDVGIGGNRDNSLPYVVISYDSLVTPPSHIAIPLNNPDDFNARRVLKEKQVDGYDKELFACERFTVKSRDGVTDIPVSMLFQRDAFAKNKGKVPTHLYGYGSYGAAIEASFRSTRLPLLKRGVVYVLAHVRGGGELGRPWYEEPNGKYLGKKNSFNDFVDIARWLTDKTTERNAADEKGRGITIPSKLSCEGKSAGGCEYLSTLALVYLSMRLSLTHFLYRTTHYIQCLLVPLSIKLPTSFALPY